MIWGRPAAAAAVLALCAVAIAGGTASPGGALRPALAADRPVIAVADFYSPGAPPLSVVTDLEPYAADAFTGFLVRGGGGALTVLPRSEVRAQERSLGWRSRDALSYARLGALAQALRADRVLTGWITQVSVYRQDFLVFDAYAAVNVQIYDARQGRIVWQRPTDGSGQAGFPDFAAQIALERALGHGVEAAVKAASAPVDQTAP